jgi:hypothetical protein
VFRIDFDLAVEEVHDPVHGDGGLGIGPFLRRAVAPQTNVGNFHDERRLLRPWMTLQIIATLPSDNRDIRLGFTGRKGNWLISQPARQETRKAPEALASGAFVD